MIIEMEYIVGVGFAVAMTILSILIWSHSQALQRFGVITVLLLSAVAGSVHFGYSKVCDAMTQQYLELFVVHFGSAYPYLSALETNAALGEEDVQEQFAQIAKILTDTLPVTTAGCQSLRYRNLCVVKDSGTGDFAECFFDGKNPRFWETAEMQVKTMIAQAAVDKSVIYRQYGEDGALFVLTDREDIVPSYAVAAEISLLPLHAQLDMIWRQYVLRGSVLFLAFSMLAAVLVFVQEREFNEVVRIVVRVSQGKEDWSRLKQKNRKSVIRSNGMRMLYNSLWQIASDIERMNYVKVRMLWAYYRFAPKEIERILHKESILDVGDTDKAELEGTLAFVSPAVDESFGEEPYQREMNRSYVLLAAARKAYGGIILSGNSDLSIIQVLFREETKKAYAFGVELASAGIFICLHRTRFVYGVAGDDEQAFTYMHCAEMKLLERYLDPFRRMGVRMVVTDYVYEAVGEEETKRYIGYIENNAVTFHIYEALDAHSAIERKKRVDLKPKFQKALTLFYEGDAYLARNAFSEVLRDCPTDKVAKWYLFLCEDYLNSDGRKQQSFALFS